MKTLAHAILAGLFAVALPKTRGEETLASPNGQVSLVLDAGSGGLSFAISHRGKPVIDRSPIAIQVDRETITQGARATGAKRRNFRETYRTRGIHSLATNSFNELVVGLRGAAGQEFSLEIRAFDDGVAFRHVIPGTGSRVPDESTSFAVPAGSVAWHHDLEGHYEDVHDRSAAEDIPKGVWVAPPMTFKLPGSTGYGAITEAAAWNYSGMALQSDGGGVFRVGLGHKHPASYPFRLRYSNDVERVSQAAAVNGIISSPWRVVMVGSDLNALVNSDLVGNLCPPPDPKLFPRGMETEWIKPGRAVWKYLDGSPNTFENMKEFSRLAGELGFEYHVIEGFWSRWSDEQIKELVGYSRERNVGLWFWRHSRELRTPESRAEFFGKLRRLGVVGAKIDFFDHEHKEVMDLYTALLEEGAKHEIMVNFHGANKPTGESRTWPNELIREAVRGMESSRLQARAKHDATLPFTRYLAGHGDYTPVHFGARRADTTWAHQIATAAIFNEPLLTYGAHPTNLLSNPGVEMIKSIPSVWDETIVLPVSEIGEIAAFARRAGANWFLAVVNGPSARSIDVPLDFLGSGESRALVVRDPAKESGAALLVVERTTLRADAKLKMEMPAGGGYIARFSAINRD